MDFLGVGPIELIFVLLIIFLVLGPDDLAATGKKIGRFLSTVRKSDFWRGVNEVSKEIRSLPTTLMREAELEDAKKEIERDFNRVKYMPQEFKMNEFKIPEQKLADKPDPIAQPESESEPDEVPVQDSQDQPTSSDPAPADGEDASKS
jgi:Sec-independent protein translocase protein TatA